MAHFYGLISGQAGEATRMGSKRSGYHAWAQNRHTRMFKVLVADAEAKGRGRY